MNLKENVEGNDFVFFGDEGRSHIFSLRCKPWIFATIQTQKCEDQVFQIDNYNSGMKAR